jgi:DNA-binding MarR family transcriptional regulator
MNNSSFGFAKPEDSLGFLLWQITTTWQRSIKRALDPFGITHPQFVIMASLLWFQEKKQISTQVMIANMTGLDKMTVSTAVRTLLSLEYVTRAEHKTDTRAKTVQLTVSGKKLIAKMVPIVESVDAEFFGILSVKEQKGLAQSFLSLHGKSGAFNE